MFDHVSGKLKLSAWFVFGIGVIVSIVAGILCFTTAGELNRAFGGLSSLIGGYGRQAAPGGGLVAAGILIILFGSVISYIVALLVYGFGQIAGKAVKTEEEKELKQSFIGDFKEAFPTGAPYRAAAKQPAYGGGQMPLNQPGYGGGPAAPNAPVYNGPQAAPKAPAYPGPQAAPNAPAYGGAQAAPNAPVYNGPQAPQTPPDFNRPWMSSNPPADAIREEPEEVIIPEPEAAPEPQTEEVIIPEPEAAPAPADIQEPETAPAPAEVQEPEAAQEPKAAEAVSLPEEPETPETDEPEAAEEEGSPEESEKPESAEEISGKICPQCGTKNDKEAMFCKHCGTKF